MQRPPLATTGLLLALMLGTGCTAPGQRDVPPPPGTGQAAQNGYPRAGNPPFYEVFGRRYFVMNSASSYRERGVASWYGRKFHGRPTSSGEIFDMHAMTAAHKTLPLPSYAEVRNLSNGRSVVVKINDRGPFVANRLIDLSYAAARELDLVTAGTGLVEVRTLDAREFERHNSVAPAAIAPATGVPAPLQASASASEPAAIAPSSEPTVEHLASRLLIDETLHVPTKGGPVFVQLGAFGDPINAERLRVRLTGYGFNDVHVAQSGSEPAVFRVRIGPINGTLQYDALVERMARYEIKDSYLTVD